MKVGIIGTGTLAWIVWSSKDNTKMNVTIGDLADVSFKETTKITFVIKAGKS